QEIRIFPIQAIDFVGVDETLDVERARRLELYALQILRGQQNIFAFGNFVALYQIGPADGPGVRVRGDHFDTIVGFRIDELKGNVVCACNGVDEDDRTGDERQPQMALPGRTSHAGGVVVRRSGVRFRVCV